MKNLINFDDVNNKIIAIRNQNVILDSDVAMLYGVETMRINEAVRNNPDKFPVGYVFELSKQEWHKLRASIIANSGESVNSKHLIENFDKTSVSGKKSINLIKNSLKSPVQPKAFTEKGLYMLATILKSERATQTTITIVETFAKLRELSNNLIALSSADIEVIEPEVIEKTGSLLDEILFSGIPTSAETSVELNLGLMKLKRSVKSEDSTLRQEMSEMKRMIEELLKKEK